MSVFLAYRNRKAFSLVEVVLAVGVATFALIAIVSLLPVGLKTVTESEDESRAINLISAIRADRMAENGDNVSKIYQFPAFTAGVTTPITNFFAVKEDETYLDKNLVGARYRVDYVVNPPAVNSLNPWTVWVRVSWPAQSTNSSSSVEQIISFRNYELKHEL